MLSLFPQILWLAPFSSTILRLATGTAFLYIGYLLIIRRGEYGKIRIPIFGTVSPSIFLASGIVTIFDGFALLVGYATQAAALLGMIIAFKHFFLFRSFGSLRPLPKSTCIMIFLMCLALLLSGAGPLGFDLPL